MTHIGTNPQRDVELYDGEKLSVEALSGANWPGVGVGSIVWTRFAARVIC